MKLAVLSESSADEAAVRILVDGLLKSPTEPVDLNRFAARIGWPGRLNVLPAVVKHLHYHTDAEALAFVVDSDRSNIHEQAHEAPGGADKSCRLCQVWESLKLVQSRLKPAAGRQPLKLAVGLAVPCLEAWLRCGKDRRVTEAAWRLALSTNQFPYDARSLKTDVYGTHRPSIQIETACMTQEARRLAAMVDELERWFPDGFGTLARAIRNW